MAYNIKPGVTGADLEEAAPQSEERAWEEPGETLVREGDCIWVAHGTNDPIRVQIEAIEWPAFRVRIWAREI